MADTTLRMQRIYEREQEEGLHRMRRWAVEGMERTTGQVTLIQGCRTDPIHHSYVLMSKIIGQNSEWQGVCVDFDAKIISYLEEQQSYFLRLPPPTNEFLAVWYQHYINTFMRGLYWIQRTYPQAAHYSVILSAKQEDAHATTKTP